MQSVAPYMRRRADGALRIQNALYDRADDDLVYEAVHYYERCQEAAWGLYYKLLNND